jgi:hypothetical protein
MLDKLMQWFRGGSDASSAEPATAPEPPSMPPEPTPEAAEEMPVEPAADEPS